MDPTTALTDLREKVHALEDEEVAVTFDGLDEWLQRGGFLPQQWSKAAVGRHRADRSQEHLEGFQVGTRRGYNAGCGCNACTMANRLRRNLTQTELRAMT
jgi:hypothetical protein